MKSTVVIVALLGLTTTAWAQAPRVVDSDFVVRTAADPAGRSTRVVPLQPNDACYDWRLRIGKLKGELDVVETMTLPAAPEIWNTDPQANVSGDKLVATTPLSLVPQDGWIGHGWCVAEGDPAGDYTIVVQAGAVTLQTFAFTVQAP